MSQTVNCPECGSPILVHRNPVPTVDVIIHEPELGVLLIERRNPPYGWALPGGFVDYGEKVETAAIREAKEETGLEVELLELLGVYSSPDRDARMHTMSVTFTARAKAPHSFEAGDDAGNAAFFQLEALPEPLAFDHAAILEDFKQRLSRRDS